jgi:hypothetical protein
MTEEPTSEPNQVFITEAHFRHGREPVDSAVISLPVLSINHSFAL